MKWLVFVLPFLLQTASAAPVISDDFYLNNGTVYESDSVVANNILPNTLRLILSEGESGELRADLVPTETTERRMQWSIAKPSGIINIYPHGNECTVVGVAEGKENILVEAEGGASASIEVEVKKTPEIHMRSFDYEGESVGNVIFTDRLMNSLVRILLTLGAVIVFCAMMAAVRRKGERKK